VCADSGEILGSAVRADVCVTMQAPKPALVLEPGRGHAGRVVIARIGIAEPVEDVAADAEVLTRGAVGARLPERPAAGHKGSFGHVLVAAGSEGKTGAAALAADGAARAGAGLVTIACPAGLNDILEIKCTEAMTVPVADTSDRALAAAAAGTLLALAAERSAMALGPGIGRSDETRKLVRSVVPRLTVPLVLDADGLAAYAGEPAALAARTTPVILTPHPGEAAQLLGTTPADVNRDRIGAARSLAATSRCVVALKGAATVIAAPDGRVRLNPTGGPALGSGGTGDVLSGVVAALLAQGLEAFEAASVAVFIHGAAGDRLSAAIGGAGLIAGDLAAAIPATCADLRIAAAAPDGPGQGLAVSFPEP
jgi:NAD(P)H-hydrate epimerase